MDYNDPLEDYISSIVIEDSENSFIVTIKNEEKSESIFGMSQEKEEEIFFTQFLN